MVSTFQKKSVLGSRTVESIAGLSAGFMTTLISHPLDFFKLRLQLDTESKSQIQSFKKITRDLMNLSKLIKNIYRGVGPNLVGSTTAWGLYFMFYREYKTLISYASVQAANQDQGLNSIHYLMCAFAAGWSTSILTNPIWVIKTRMITTSRTAPGAYTSILDGVQQIYRKEGITGYYKGLTPALISVSQGALQFSIYDTLKHHIIMKPNRATKEDNKKGTDGNITTTKSEQHHLSTFQYLYASATSKMIATVVFYPLQVVRSRLQANYNVIKPNMPTLKSKGKFSMSSVCRSILKYEGIKGFYKGLFANLIRVLPATCITFAVYENVKRSLS
ncbi:hypothetical protein CANARDRAFT_176013 [[Candida] arabinofermentans NRRL YB-2248]|uniref:Uncharacterized protein n=1 Tax=[Candida] arabinofermentans NRRL YB-2248 TaxID=983967 RepID=A0A1E4T1D1_9ASCO|nr:hypothetical protein CANARDRAFT_176013 [[Candida] arabinofermentans NRRL YB-2248]